MLASWIWITSSRSPAAIAVEAPRTSRVPTGTELAPADTEALPG